MAHFYGTLHGRAGEASRLGSKDSGISSSVETWSSSVQSDYQFSRGLDTEVVRVRFGRKSWANTTILDLKDPDAVVDVMSDPKMAKLFDQFKVISDKINAELPKAQRRAELARKRAERERVAQQKEAQAA